jgi:hypothetical protein
MKALGESTGEEWNNDQLHSETRRAVVADTGGKLSSRRTTTGRDQVVRFHKRIVDEVQAKLNKVQQATADYVDAASAGATARDYDGDLFGGDSEYGQALQREEELKEAKRHIEALSPYV